MEYRHPGHTIPPRCDDRYTDQEDEKTGTNVTAQAESIVKADTGDLTEDK